MKNYKVKEGYALVLRTNDRNNQSRDKFQYPETGYIEAPDWMPTHEYGNGLHGVLNGVGTSGLLNWDSDAIWMVLEVKEDELIDLKGKVKFKGGEVICSGTRQKVTHFLYEIYGNIGIIRLDYHSDGEVVVVGGYKSTLTGGDGSILTGSIRSTLTGGDGSILKGGDGSILKGGDGSILKGGIWSTINGGDGSTLKGGDYSILNFRYWDGNRYRIRVAYVGEDGIKANTKYRLNDNFEIEEVK